MVGIEGTQGSLTATTHRATVDANNRLHVYSTVSGTPEVIISGGIHIGSVSANVDSIYIQSGANMEGSAWILDDVPTSQNKNNPQWKFEYSGTVIGSITQFIGTGSYVSVFGYTGANLTSIGSWA